MITHRPVNLAKRALHLVEFIGLVIIAIATVIAAGIEIANMVTMQRVALEDLLMLFLFLEVLAMIALYFESGQLPVRYPLYIAIVALARYLILDVKSLDVWRIVGVASAMMLLAITVLVLRYGHVKFPYVASEREGWPQKKPSGDD